MQSETPDSESYFQAASRVARPTILQDIDAKAGGNVRYVPGTRFTRDDLSFIGADNRATVEPGDFDVMLAGATERKGRPL